MTKFKFTRACTAHTLAVIDHAWRVSSLCKAENTVTHSKQNIVQKLTLLSTQDIQTISHCICTCFML